MATSSVQRGIDHFAIATRDWDGTNSFYRDGLGFSVKFGWDTPLGRAVYLDAGDGRCVEIYELKEGVEFPEPVPEGPIVHICLRTDDLDAAYAKMKSLGLKAIGEPFEGAITPTTGGDPVAVKACFFEGPTGEWIEFLESPESGRCGVRA
jgi:catechol 2,3-dioxygenase-like lactoylglutathione lyase family enzyme